MFSGRTMEITTEIQSNLPLTETTLYILLSLAPGPRHGYAIMKDVRALSHNRVELSTGTLYSALKRLLDQNWIRERLSGQSETPYENDVAHVCAKLLMRGHREANP